MKALASHSLVIDASVVRSAGITQHPVSSACREVLESVLNICHRAVLTDIIDEEWKRHMSKYSRKWRRFMEGRKKLRRDVVPNNVTIDMRNLSDTECNVVKKDLFLIEAALSADGIIVTCDETFRQAIAKITQGSAKLKSITWKNPVTDGCEWLERL